MKYQKMILTTALATLGVAALLQAAPQPIGASASVPASKVPTGMVVSIVTGASGPLWQLRVTIPSSAGTLRLQPGNVLVNGVSTPQYTLTPADLALLGTPTAGLQDVYLTSAPPANPTLEVGIGAYGHKLLAFGGPVLATMAVERLPLLANSSGSYNAQTIVRLRVSVPASDGLNSLTIQSATAKINGVSATAYTPTTAERLLFPTPTTPGLNQQDLYFKRVNMPLLVVGMTTMELTANLGPNGIVMVATGPVTVN